MDYAFRVPKVLIRRYMFIILGLCSLDLVIEYFAISLFVLKSVYEKYTLKYFILIIHTRNNEDNKCKKQLISEWITYQSFVLFPAYNSLKFVLLL